MTSYKGNDMNAAQKQVPSDNEGAGVGQDYQPLDRLNAFSDGVFAIVITLLVLDLPVPPITELVLPALAESWPEFLGYAISFAFVGGIWLSHAALTKAMKRADAVSYRLNLVVLLFVSLLPFTTKLMVTHMGGPDARTAVAIYGLNLLVASLMLTGLMVYVARDRELVVDDVADERIKRAYRQRQVFLGLGALTILVGLVAPVAAVGAYVIITIGFILEPLTRLARKR
jgi:uncharacterized membrane protein